LRLIVKVKPGSRRPGVTRDGASIVVSVREPATDGKANFAVIRAVAAWLNVPPSRVELEGGAASRTKRLAIEIEANAYERALRAL
jgi:uncharacterized protein YggU (UPF0235/DUF167 family)